VSESPFRGATPQPSMGGREFRALDEHSFIQNTDTRLDEFLAQGREVLDNLVDQRNILKGTQRRLLDTANTLGLSRNVIGWIEKRRYVSYDSPFCRNVLRQRTSQHPGHIHLRCWCCLHFLLFLADMALPRLRLVYINIIISI